MMTLKPVSDGPIPCKICRAPAPVYGIVDFNTCCRIPNAINLLPIGVPVPYRRCGACGFLFTDAFDDWSHADFRTHIYNDGYLAVDPEYLEAWPRNNANLLVDMFGAQRAERRVLDFGGGNDVLCSALRAAEFPVAVTYDPFVPAHAAPPEGTFDLITCFETLEHMPDPLAGIGAIVATVAEPGLVPFSTLVQPQNFDTLGIGWWYVGPRNGHVSLFSRKSLVHAWAGYGYHVVSFDDNLHIAFRTLPDYTKHLFK